jgi:Tol biopolymer transport system component
VVQDGVAPMQFAVSDDGALVYGVRDTDHAPAVLTGLSGTDGALPLRMPTMSPDYQRLAGVSGDPSSSDIWVTEVNRGAATRLTHGGINVSPIWNASGTAVFFASAKRGAFELWLRDGSAGTAERKVFAATGRHVFPTSVSPDGRLIAVVESGGPSRADIWTVPVEGGEAAPLVQTPFDEVGAVFSPDGRLLAYQSDESGRWQVYVMNLEDRRRVAVSTAGGTRPMWHGQSLYFVAGTDLVAVPVDPSGRNIGTPRVVRPLNGAEPFAIDGDALFSRSGGSVLARKAVLTLEWLRELRQTLGPPAAMLPR